MTDSDTPTFSVCLCTFNDAETIEACLDSILPQLDHRYELVVTDGGSVDGTLEHVEQRKAVADVDIRIFAQDEPGLGYARQVCVDNARGEYLLEQVDADMVFAECFDKLVEFYLETVKTEGPFQLYTKGLRITPRHLHEELGGWRPFPHGFQENELTRRFFGHGYLRLMNVRVAKHMHPEFGLETAVRRYLYNYREKLRCGISLRYAYEHLYTSDLPVWRKLLDTGTILLTYLWGLGQEQYDTFNARDPLAYEIDRELYKGCKDGTYEDIQLTPPQDIEEACFDATEDKVYSYTDA